MSPEPPEHTAGLAGSTTINSGLVSILDSIGAGFDQCWTGVVDAAVKCTPGPEDIMDILPVNTANLSPRLPAMCHPSLAEAAACEESCPRHTLCAGIPGSPAD